MIGSGFFALMIVGSTKLPGPIDALAAANDFAAFGDRPFDRRLERLDGIRGDQRPDQHAVFQRIADLERRIRLGQPRAERIDRANRE